MENILQYKSDKGKLKVYNFYLKQKIVFCVLFQVYPLPLKSIMMADKKENEMQEGIPTKLRGLDVEGNSINVSMKEAKKSFLNSATL